MMEKVFSVLIAVFVTSTLIVAARVAPAQSSEQLREQIIEWAKKEGELVVLGSLADEFQEALVGFHKKYPFIEYKAISSTTKKTLNRIFTESRGGRVTVDIFDTGDDGGYILQRARLIQKPQIPFPHLRHVEPRLLPSSGLFVPYLEYPRIQGSYNTELVPPDEVPDTWEEMTSPKWKGKVMLSASAEEMPAQFAYLWREGGRLNWERSFDLFRKLAAQDLLITQGYTRGNNQIAAGEKAIFWLSVLGQPGRMAVQQGAPIGVIAFDRYPTTVRVEGIVKGAPHPAAAWLFIDYLISPEGQFELTDQIRPGIPVSERAKLGALGKWAIARGVTREHTALADPNFTLDNHAELTYNEAANKKSTDFFFELLGIR